MKLQYRPDIDGLRAIAVLLVLFHHVGWSLFSGGYIGVDVFFVISGYLISSIVMQDIQAGQFSIATFYQKRVLRLAPAYFAVLFTVSVVAFQLLLPQELTQYFYSVIYACVFAANIFMYQEVGDYFSGDVSETPLLHLWSLGVEEQFYLLWPILLLLGFAVFHKKSNRWGLWLTLTLLLASLLYSHFAIQENPAKAYYWMPVRAFELFMGAILYFLPTRNCSYTVRKLTTYVALGVMAFCTVLYEKTTLFPGVAALPVCLATAAIIYIGQRQQDHTRLLGSAPMRWIGKISYPLYLWHWPVVVMFQLLLLPQNLWTQLAIISISIALAYATYRYVEQPCVRFRKWSPRRCILLFYVLPASLFCLFAAWVMHADGLPQRFKPDLLHRADALQTFAHEIREDCHNTAPAKKLPKADDCILGVNKSKIDFLLIGDSHANHFTGMLDVWAYDAGLRGYDITQDTTVYLPEVKQSRQIAGQWQPMPKYKRRNDAITQHLKQHHYDVVILSGYFSVYLQPEMRLQDVAQLGGQAAVSQTNAQQDAALQKTEHNREVFYHGLRRAVLAVVASGARPIIMIDSPVLNGQKAICQIRAESLHLKRDCSLPISQLRLQQAAYMPVLRQLQTEFPQLILLDPNKVLCDAERCKLALNGVPLYRDKDFSHLNDTGSRELGRAYLKQYGNPLQRRYANNKQ